MTGINRQAVHADRSVVSAKLDHTLAAIVADLAEGLDRPQNELIPITFVRLNVIADCRCFGDSLFKTERAERMQPKL